MAKQRRYQRQLLRIDARVQRALSKSEAIDFEGPHHDRVVQYSALLVALRGIPAFEALAAAMLHDAGRLIGGVEGKGHAAAGADLAEGLLKRLGVSRSATSRIVAAIGKHSDKKSVTAPLDELLKDADALAHREDFGATALNWQEQLRCQRAFIPVTRPEWTLVQGFVPALTSALAAVRLQVGQFEKELSAFRETLYDHSPEATVLVHETRNALRQLDTVLWVAKQVPQDFYLEVRTSAIALKPMAKALFRALGPLRDGHVDRQRLASLVDTLLPEAVSDSAVAEDTAHLHRHCLSLLAALDSALKTLSNAQQPEVSSTSETVIPLEIQALLAPHRSALVAATKKEITTLHRLRIQGKRLRVLKKLGWLQIDEGLSEALDDYHKQVGSLLDTERLLRLLATQHSLGPSMIEGVMDLLVSERAKAMQKTERALLALRLQCRFY